MKLLYDRGLSPKKVLQGATTQGAALLNIHSSYGLQEGAKVESIIHLSDHYTTAPKLLMNIPTTKITPLKTLIS